MTQLATREKMLPIFTVLGRKVRAHNSTCADSFREDRKHGLIYPAIHVYTHTIRDGRPMSHEAASLECNFCCYCGTI